LSNVADNRPCQQDGFGDPKVEVDGKCFTFQSKRGHDRFNGRCVEWNEVGIIVPIMAIYLIEKTP